MSNVLIGVIGVILFIGLALAGALFLGPRFQSARAGSEASAYMMQLRQISDATTMRNVETGSQIAHKGDDLGSLPDSGYLRGGLEGYDFTELDGGPNAQMAFKSIPDTESNRRVCQNIQRNAGQISAGDPFYDVATNLRETKVQQGCIVWRFRTGTLAVFTRI